MSSQSAEVHYSLSKKPSDYALRANHDAKDAVTFNEAGEVHVDHRLGHQHHFSGKAGSEHTFEDEEVAAFSQLINTQLREDALTARHIPLDVNSNDIFSRLDDGLILTRLINIAAPGTIEEKRVNHQASMSVFQKNENLNLAIKGAVDMGCHVVNIGANDISEGRPIAILGLLWQIFRYGFVSSINISGHPELALLLETGESLQHLNKLSPEQLLLRWVQHHLNGSGRGLSAVNFSDFRNPEVFLALIHQLDPSVNGLIDPSEDPLSLAQRVIDGARALGVETFLRASDILSGNPRLALGFTAQLFNTCGLKFNIQGVVLARYINLVLKDDASVTHLLPLNPFSADIYLKQSDGRILAGLLNHAIPDTINVSELIAGPNLGNVLAVLVTAREIGAELGNLNAEEVFDGRPHTVLVALWAVIRLQVLAQVKTSKHPELSALALEGEDSTAFEALRPDALLLRWLNYHLLRGGCPKAPVSNLDTDLKDPCVFAKLVQELKKSKSADASTVSDCCSGGGCAETTDALATAAQAVADAEALGAASVVLPSDLLFADAVVNTLFLTALFNTHVGLRVTASQETIAFSAHVNRVLRDNAWVGARVPLCINSNDIFLRTRDGVIYAELLNQVRAGVVDTAAVSAKAAGGLSSPQDYVDQLAPLYAAIVQLGGDVQLAPIEEVAAGKHQAVLELILIIIKLKITAHLTTTTVALLVAELQDASVTDVISTIPPAESLFKLLDVHLEHRGSVLRVDFNASV